MPYQIHTSRFSFVQFAQSDTITGCDQPAIHLCLPVYEANDVWFQWVIQADTDSEADDLCDIDSSSVSVGIVLDCADGFLIEFGDKPERYRISSTQVLYVWKHGLPGFTGSVEVGECFRIKIEVADQSWCSNCFQRIGDDCHTSVVEYYGEENQFGFNYCASNEGIESEAEDCDPTIIQFTNQANMVIPWTAFLQGKYGIAPTVEVWVNDGGELVKAGLRVAFDTYPPTELRIDFGGVSSGIVKIL